MVRDKAICMAPSSACCQNLESLFGQFNQVLQEFDDYILEVKGVVLKELQETEQGQSRDSLSILHTVQVPKTPGMKKKRGRKKKLKSTVKLLLDSPTTTIQDDPETESDNYSNVDDCMTPNRCGTPMMKGKRLRSLLEDHQKTGGRMTRSQVQTGSCASNASEIPTGSTQPTAKKECPVIQSVDCELEDSPYVNSTMLFPGTPKSNFSNITIIEVDSTPRRRVSTPLTKEKITRLSSTPAITKSTCFASAEDELIITPILQSNIVSTISLTPVQQLTTTCVESAPTPEQAIPQDILLKEALIRSNIKSTPKVLSPQTPENKILTQLQKSTVQPFPEPTPSTYLTKLNLINDTTSDVLTPPQCGVSSIGSTQPTPHQMKFPEIESTMDDESGEVPLMEKENYMECILEESVVEIKLPENKVDKMLDLLVGEEEENDDEENVEPAIELKEEEEMVELLEEEEEEDSRDVSNDLYEDALKEQEVVVQQVKEDESTVAAVNTEKEQTEKVSIEGNEVSEEPKPQSEEPDVFVQDSSEDTNTESESAEVKETDHDPVTDVAESIPEEEISKPVVERLVPEEEIIKPVVKGSVPEEEVDALKEEILEKPVPEKEDVKPERSTRNSAKNSSKNAIHMPEVIPEETVRTTRSSAKKCAEKKSVVDVVQESATRITRSSNKTQQHEPELEEEFHTPTQDVSTLPRIGTVRKMVERIESPKKEFTLPNKKKQQIPRLNETIKRDRDTDEESTNSNYSPDESIHMSKKQKGNGGTPRNMKVPGNLMTSMFSMVNRPQDIVVKTAKELEQEKKQAARKRIEEKDAKAQEVLNKKKEKADQLRMARREKEKRLVKARQNREADARKKKEDTEKKMKLKDAAAAKERDALAKKEEEKRMRETRRAEQALQKRKQEEKARELKKKQLQEEALERKEEATRRKQELEEKRVRDLERQRQEESARLEEQRKIEAEELCKRQKAEEFRRNKEEDDKRKREKTPIIHKTKKNIPQSGGPGSANAVGHLIQYAAETPIRPPRIHKGELKSKIPSKLTKESEPEPTVPATPVKPDIIDSPPRSAIEVESPASATTNRLTEYMKNKINKMSTQSSTCNRLLSINENSVMEPRTYLPADNYNIDDLETDDDTDDDTKPKNPIPKWCNNKPEFRAKLKQQFCGNLRVKHTDLYGPYIMPDLDMLFKTTNKFKSRTSSAHWASAPATGELDFSILSEEECVRAKRIAEVWSNK